MILRLVSRRPWKALRFLFLILVLDPVGAWYKHVASPKYHTVGRASGLLMGVGRSPYLLRRALEEESAQSPDAASSLPAHRASPQWLKLRRHPAGAEPEPWTTPEHPRLGSRGALARGRAGQGAFLRQASPRTQATGNLWAVLQHQGAVWASQCLAGCEGGTPWRRPPLYSELLKRALGKNEQPEEATQETRAFSPEI